MKNIAFFDIDGTLFYGQSQELLIKYCYKKKLIIFFDLLVIYTWFFLYKLGLSKDPKPIMQYAFRLLKNKDFEFAKEVFGDFYDSELSSRKIEVIHKKMAEHLNNGDLVYLLSNVMLPLARTIGAKLGVENIFATNLEKKNDVYTGKIEGDIMYGKQKAEIVNRELIKNKDKYQKSFAYFDHLSDFLLAQNIDNVTVVRPDKKTEKKAEENNWQIIK
jgi:HAD superfamily hydrolase (TIGR01490 family)